MQPNQVVLVVVSVFAGSLGGAAVSAWLARSQEPARARVQLQSEPVKAPESAPAAAPLLAALGQGRVQEHLDNIEARVGKLEHAEPSADAVAAAAEPPPAEFYHRMHAETIREHRAEALDPSWGPATVPVLKKDFERAQGLGKFEVGAVDCRTTTCSVALKWPSLGAAKSHYTHAIGASLRIGCSKTVVIPDEANADGSVDATLMLDCTDWRASGAEPMAEADLPPPPIATQTD